jgi:Cu2+-exporting ATPase
VGILIKGGDALERLAKPATLVLDKTGTLTEGTLSLVAFEGPDWVRPLVLALESESSHPLAQAFRQGFGVTVVPHVESSRHVIGAGIEGIVSGRAVVVGKPSFVRATTAAAAAPANDLSARIAAESVTDADGTAASSAVASHRGLTEVLIAVDGAFVGRAWFGDAIRGDAAASVAALQRAGWQVSIASGDAQSVVDSVARAVGIAPGRAIGDATPEEKLAIVQRLAASGPVVMVGDGVNDAAAIAAASVGIGVHGGAEASLAAADVSLSRPGLAVLVELVRGARSTMDVIRLGIILSLAYNVAGVGLAMFGLINPLVAAIMMPASSLTVILVAWRRRTFAEVAS